MPMGSSRVGGLLLRRAPLKVEDPRAETSDFSGSTPDVISYNKGQCNERLALREVGSGRKEEGCQRKRSSTS